MQDVYVVYAIDSDGYDAVQVFTSKNAAKHFILKCQKVLQKWADENNLKYKISINTMYIPEIDAYYIWKIFKTKLEDEQ